MRESVRALLAADGTLKTLLLGGVFGGEEISRQGTPAAFDAHGELLPCALVRLETETPTGLYPTGSRLYLVVFFYQRSGYDVIDAAVARTFVLLHHTKAGVTSGVWEVVHANDVLDQEDTALNCSLGMSRYVMTRLR